jgi:D-glycero-D-manno-heptose 1,7-bisphosphate phosphatase
MCARFDAERAPIARVYHCPIIPSTASASTVAIIPGASPIPGMILQAVSVLALDPARCVILGDKLSDIEAGRAGRERPAASARIGARRAACSRAAALFRGAVPTRPTIVTRRYVGTARTQARELAARSSESGH